MARRKEYVEGEIAERAMHLFWKKGYGGTTVRELEKQMGVNQFSIYACFKSKQGLLREAISIYEKQIHLVLLKPLEGSKGDLNDIKAFFYKFVDFVRNKEDRTGKGCLMINTIQELGKEDEIVKKEIMGFIIGIKAIFVEVLTKALSNGYIKPELDVERYANYLVGVLQGLSTAGKHFSKTELEDFIELSVHNIDPSI